MSSSVNTSNVPLVPSTSSSSKILVSNKRKQQKQVRYPIMQECAQILSDDPFWVSIFTDISYGKCPPKVLIDDKSIWCLKKNSFSYVYANKPATVIAKEIKDLLKNFNNLSSFKDQHEEEKKIEAVKDMVRISCLEDKWNKISTKKTKELLITYFVIQKKKELKLSKYVAQKAYKIINDAFWHYHTHKTPDVIMDKGLIKEIKDIDLITPANKRRDLQLDKKPAPTKFDVLKKWEQYVTSLYKKVSSSPAVLILNETEESDENASVLVEDDEVSESVAKAQLSQFSEFHQIDEGDEGDEGDEDEIDE